MLPLLRLAARGAAAPRRTGWRGRAPFVSRAAATFSTRGPPPPVPVVYHPLYSAPKLAPGHQFPMQVRGQARFHALAHAQRRQVMPRPAVLRTICRWRVAVQGAAASSLEHSSRHCTHTQVFGRIHERLIRTGTILESQVRCCRCIS